MSQLSFDDFLKRAQKADQRLLRELTKRLTIISLKLERQAKKNATEDPSVRTGRLRSSITGFVDAPMGTPRVVLRAGGSSSNQDVDYAKYVEFGTRYIRPRLFLGRAINAERERLDDQLSDLLNVSLGGE